MMRLTFLFVCVCLVTTCAADSSKIYPVRQNGPLVGYQAFSGYAMFNAIGDAGSCAPQPPWAKPPASPRYKQMKITFTKPFDYPPMVTYSLTALDSRSDRNLRYYVEVLYVTKTSFYIKFSTWCNTYIYTAKVQYWATGVRTVGYVGLTQSAT
eukprot:g7298.t1